MADRDSHLWFLQLSGWPVFLLTVAATMIFSGVMTVVLTKMANGSVVQNMVLAGSAVAIATLSLLAVVALLSRL